VCKRGVNAKYRGCDNKLWMTLAIPPAGRHLAGMTMTITLAIGAFFLALAVFAGWRGSRPPDLVKGVRMIPWRAVMVFSSAGVLILLVHVVNLLGVSTGR
jgi:hypothetical protein